MTLHRSETREGNPSSLSIAFTAILLHLDPSLGYAQPLGAMNNLVAQSLGLDDKKNNVGEQVIYSNEFYIVRE